MKTLYTWGNGMGDAQHLNKQLPQSMPRLICVLSEQYVVPLLFHMLSTPAWTKCDYVLACTYCVYWQSNIQSPDMMKPVLARSTSSLTNQNCETQWHSFAAHKAETSETKAMSTHCEHYCHLYTRFLCQAALLTTLWDQKQEPFVCHAAWCQIPQAILFFNKLLNSMIGIDTVARSICWVYCKCMTVIERQSMLSTLYENWFIYM